MPTDSVQDEQLKLMRKSLIIQLGMLSVPHQTIRAIVECEMGLVTEVLQLLDVKKIKGKKGGT